MRRYVTLFKAPFVASALSDHENNALRAGSLLAMPPPAPGSQPLAGSTTVDLPVNSLTQWATHIQDVTSGMRLPPEVAVNGQKCGCSSIPHQAPSQASALWTPLTMSYTAMASSTKTTASSSAAEVPPPRYPPPGLPPLEPMDTLPAPTSENLLATAGVGRGGRGQRQPSTPTAPGLHQTRPTAPQQRTPTPGRQETNQATPYRQQVYPPRCPTGVRMTTPKQSTAPSTSQGCGETAGESKDARGRSSSQGPQS